MLNHPRTLHLLSILIVTINSAIAAEVVAPTPSPTSSHENMAIVQAQAQALIAFKDAITNDPSSYCVFTQKEDANQISHKQ